MIAGGQVEELAGKRLQAAVEQHCREPKLLAPVLLQLCE